MAAKSGDEDGHGLAALTRRKERSASSIPAAIQRFFIEPSFQLLTLRIVVRAMEIIGLDALGVGEGLGEDPVDAESADGEHVGDALEEAGGGIGLVGLEAGAPD